MFSPGRTTRLLAAARRHTPTRLVLLAALLACGIVFLVLSLLFQQESSPQPNLDPSYVQGLRSSLQVAFLRSSRRDETCRKLNKPLAEAWREKLPKQLFFSAAMGYSFGGVRLLTNSFLHMANGLSDKERLGLVFFVEDVPRGWSIVDDRIYFVRAGFAADEKGQDQQSAVHSRFVHYKCFIEALGLQNDTRIFTLDARDSVLQRNPFVYPDDGRLRFFYESGFLMDVPINQRWLESCSSPKFAKFYGGTHIVNDGTIYGTADLLARYFSWFNAKLYSISGCNDQGLHMYAVLSGELLDVVNFRMEDNEWGSVLSAFGAEKLVYLNGRGEICSKVTDEPYAIAHQYDRIDYVRHHVMRRFWYPPKEIRVVL